MQNIIMTLCLWFISFHRARYFADAALHEGPPPNHCVIIGFSMQSECCMCVYNLHVHVCTISECTMSCSFLLLKLYHHVVKGRKGYMYEIAHIYVVHVCYVSIDVAH